MDDKLSIYVAIIAGAVVVQTLMLLVLAVVVGKLGAKMKELGEKAEGSVGDLQAKINPLLDDVKVIQQEVKTFLVNSRPKIETVVDNVSRITSTARGSVERVDATVNDIVDRVRLQVIRGDEMVTRTMDRVEETSEKVQHSVMSPVRQVSGIVQAISVGMGTFFHSQKRRRNGGPSDEMFI